MDDDGGGGGPASFGTVGGTLPAVATYGRAANTGSTWSKHFDAKQGHAYYHNTTTKETSWTLPEGSTVADTAQAAAQAATGTHANARPEPGTWPRKKGKTQHRGAPNDESDSRTNGTGTTTSVPSLPGLELPADVAPGAGTVLCTKPLIVRYPGFLCKESCLALVGLCKQTDIFSCKLCFNDARWSDPERALLKAVEDRIGVITGQAVHDGEQRLLPLMAAPANAGAARFPSGFHVDANGGCQRRFASAILYLTSPQDGCTFFPLANLGAAEAAVAGSRQLLDDGVFHTSHGDTDSVLHEHAIKNILDVGSGLGVPATQGDLMVFWTRADDGDICPYSWHAGARVGGGTGHGAASQRVRVCETKYILRKFKEVPQHVWQDEAASNAFVKASRDAAQGKHAGDEHAQ